MHRFIVILTMALVAAACGNGENGNGEAEPENGGELTDFELQHGIGPITEPLDLDEIDLERAQRGADLFDSRCASCHRMEERFVGPPVGNVAENRSPEFVVNFILNPEEMVERHPVGEALLQEYLTIMPYQNVSEERALEILDFLRHYAETGEDLRE